ncbi:MAG TPA: class I SAM-dependent methyltransferase [Candidatus Limnocylindrales bacterium]|jgi:ubiquinone/menaquinone biosynthesis C-methylase UbiE|nr:class I SAM-dependent methyltransferase [Candidatus Limnocylindrales bacterium]
MAEIKSGFNPCQNPAGLPGRFVLWLMNRRHSQVTDWGLSHVSVGESDTGLDVGCGGGRTISKLAQMAIEGKVYGIDPSAQSVAVSSKVNGKSIDSGRVEVRQASVAQLPFLDNMFDLVTAVETHFWWPDIPAGMREILRVLKPGGTLVIIAEVYKAANAKLRKMEDVIARSGLKLLTTDEHRALFESTGYVHVRVFTEPKKAWICCVGEKLRRPE